MLLCDFDVLFFVSANVTFYHLTPSHRTLFQIIYHTIPYTIASYAVPSSSVLLNEPSVLLQFISSACHSKASSLVVESVTQGCTAWLRFEPDVVALSVLLLAIGTTATREELITRVKSTHVPLVPLVP